jgi:gliding motility-associated-like protein
MIGEFHRYCDFDPSTISQNSLNTIVGGVIDQDGFIQKLGQCDSTTPSIINNQTFCSLQNPTISSLTPNSNNFNWYIDATSITVLANSTSLINGQTYYVSRQNGSCPESLRTPVTVTINLSPTAPISSNQTFCEKENTSLNDIIISGQNIKWYNSNTSLTELPLNTIIQNNTTYYASQTTNGCESTRTPVFITITSDTLPIITSPQTFCIQQNATINSIAITGQNIKWYDASTNGNLLPNSTILVNGTTYYASQTINGCESNRVPVLVQIQNTPAPTGNANQSFCSTANATVSDIITNGINTIWYNSATSTTPLANTTLLTNNTTFYATQTINGCVSANRLAVTISLINTLNATNYSTVICDNLNDNTEISNLNTYNSNLISSTGNIFSYYNSYNDALSQNSAGQITNSTNYNLVLGTNTFYVRIASPNTCFQIVTLTLDLVSKPIIPINDIEPLCEGRNITLNGGNNYDSYTWSTGETSQQITITQPGNYSVIVTENHGSITCTSTKNFVVVNSNIATIQEIISSDWTDNNNTITVLLHNNSQGDYEYSLNGIDFQDSNVFNNLEAGEYTVFVRDKNGCGMVSGDLYLLMYPKFFTPNGDGYNDYWKIKFSENEPNLAVKIFDRYGKLLKHLGMNSMGWDGKYLGKDVPSSDYWFVVTRENGKELKGHFSLKR